MWQSMTSVTKQVYRPPLFLIKTDMMYQIFKIDKKKKRLKEFLKIKKGLRFNLLMEPQLYLSSKCFILALPCHISHLFNASRRNIMEKYISILQYNISSIETYIIGEKKFFLSIPAPAHMHTYTHTHFDSVLLLSVILYKCWLIQRETHAEISSTPHREDFTTKIVVNIRTKHLSGTPISCKHAGELTNEQNNKVNICVLVVYSMTFCFLYSTFESAVSFYLCSTHELWNQCFWMVLA